jgi:hypothetical protein
MKETDKLSVEQALRTHEVPKDVVLDYFLLVDEDPEENPDDEAPSF